MTKNTRVRGTDPSPIFDSIFIYNCLEIENIYCGTPIGKRDHLMLKIDKINDDPERMICTKRRRKGGKYVEVNSFTRR